MQLPRLFSFSARARRAESLFLLGPRVGILETKTVIQSLYSEMGCLCIPMWPCVWEVRLSKVRSQTPLPTQMWKCFHISDG